MMKGAIFAFAASALLGSVVAGPHRYAHEDFHNKIKRDPVDLADNSTNCGCTTYVTTYYGEATWVPTPYSSAVPSTSVAASSATPLTTSTPVATPTSVATPSPSTTEAAAVAPTSPPSGSSASSSGAGDEWCMAYSPYTTSGCKDAATVDSDIAQIAQLGFRSVRIYATDCNQVQTVGDACKNHGLNMVIGVWITSNDASAVQSQISDITSYFNGDYSIVELCIVGNEVLADIATYGVSPSTLAGFISTVKSALKANGYNGPCTTAETPASLFANAETLCAVVDHVSANIHPFFDPNTSCEEAGTYVSNTLAKMTTLCGDTRQAWNTECGWPTAGDTNGQAVPGVAEQAIAIKAVKAAAGGQTVMFSFADDYWKSPGYLNVEQSWGLTPLYGNVL